jgi:predicted nuclease of predicted toxin-antitoxin system
VLIWLDIHLSPATGRWLASTFGVECRAMRDLGMQRLADEAVFQAARKAGATVMTKDEDFINLLERLGPPPRVIWLTFGNTSNSRLCEILAKAMPPAISLLDGGEPFVEIGGAGQ